MTEYGYSVEVADGYDEAVTRTRLALRAEGFSIITEMHVGGMLGQAGGGERQYLIMGAWGAPGSDEDLQDGVRVAMHLPCNVVVHESGEAAIVAALDPADEVAGQGSATERAAVQAQAALTRVLERVVQR